jgi:type II secretory pathway component PulK
MKMRSEKGSAVVVMFCAIAMILASIGAVELTVGRALQNRHRQEIRSAALWLARSGIEHPGAREVTLDHTRLRMITHPEGQQRIAEVEAFGIGTARVSFGAPAGWVERWTWQ